MNINQAVQEYIRYKHAEGYAFERGATYLNGFAKNVGCIELSDITQLHVSTFLDSNECSDITWHLKYQVLYRFFAFWTHRDRITQFSIPHSRARAKQTFVPYIFSQGDLREIIRAAKESDNSRSQIDSQMMKTLIIILYATGVAAKEVLEIRTSHVDLSSGSIRFGTSSIKGTRDLPIGKDLTTALHRFLSWRTQRRYSSNMLFVTKANCSIKISTAQRNFKRICKIARIATSKGGSSPRMTDLKYAFAIHRIASWIIRGISLDQMMPALAAYMGQTGLGSTERYLLLTPERFKRNLEKLSPT